MDNTRMIAITGYSGFVGSHLVEQLKNEPLLLLGRKAINASDQFCHLDLANLNEEALSNKLENVSVLVHLAALTGAVKGSEKEQVSLYNLVNVDATIALARAAANAGVKRFIFLSSIKVHGETSEDNTKISSKSRFYPQDLYANSKVQAEILLQQVAKESGMDLVTIRPPLVYGKGVKANFASLINMAIKRFPLPIRSINNKRSLVSVYNLVDLICLCCHHPKAANRAFLVSDDHNLSTFDLFDKLCKVQQKPNLSFHFPAWMLKAIGKLCNKQKQVDSLISSLVVDITQTKELLNWQPPFSVEKSLKLTCQQHNDLEK